MLFSSFRDADVDWVAPAEPEPEPEPEPAVADCLEVRPVAGTAVRGSLLFVTRGLPLVGVDAETAVAAEEVDEDKGPPLAMFPLPPMLRVLPPLPLPRPLPLLIIPRLSRAAARKGIGPIALARP